MSKILRLKDVLEKVGLSRATVYRLQEQNQFPKSIQLSTRSVGWRESDISDWIESRANSSNVCNASVKSTHDRS